VNLEFSTQAVEDLKYWGKYNKKMVNRIENLIEDMQKSPFTGIGKPEPLKHSLAGYWSRRINKEHRLVYRIKKEDKKSGAVLEIIQARFHYTS